jgi:glutamate carboxypeptidase
MRAAEELGIELREDVAGGGSDGNTTSTVAATLDGLGAVGGGAHAIDEHVIVDHMPERAALVARLLDDPALTGAEARRSDSSSESTVSSDPGGPS